MTKDKAIAELIRIWHSPHLDLSLKAGLAEVIETLKENNQSDSLVTDSSDACKESKSKLDLISRQDAIEAIESRQTEQWIESDIDYNSGLESALCEIKALPSADITETETCQRCQDLTDTILNRQGDEIKRLKAEARPTVIRSRTLLPTKDFKEWAKRIMEVNPNAVVIPCDAEAPSAEAVEVVRCKDCLMTKERDEYTGKVWCCRHREYMDDMYYCADGLRREDGEA